MDERRNSNAQLGAMVGIIGGAGVGGILFAATGDVFWLATVGLGIAFGLGIGSIVDRQDR